MARPAVQPDSAPSRVDDHAETASIEHRVDPLTGDHVYVVGGRQSRPNLPAAGCPFCVGGREAPEPYVVKSFPNRWPPLPDGRAEVVLYTPDHDATLWSLGSQHATRVVDLWAERTAALGARPDVEYVMPFETRGPEIGATITHPHGQIYAFEFVPELPRRKLELGSRFDEPGERLIGRFGAWNTWVPAAPPYPYMIRIAPTQPWVDLPALPADARRDLARALVDSLERMDRLFGGRAPTMMWIHQQPSGPGSWPPTRLHVELVSPWRAPNVLRHLAAGETGSHAFFNTIVPEDAAAQLREALTKGCS